MSLVSRVLRGGLLRGYRTRVFSRPLHSALKRQLKAEKKQKDKETKEAQQPQAVVSEYFSVDLCSVFYGVT